MTAPRADIIADLQRQLLPLQGYKKPVREAIALDLGIINEAFPFNTFPTGAIHEFITANPSEKAATAGFVMGIVSQLASHAGVCMWISSSRTLFPPALISFGIEPDKVIFLDLEKETDCLWAMEESLKCDGLSAVVCETPNLGFTASRRFQLAVESTGVTGFMLRHDPKRVPATACLSRWKISPLRSETENNMPGIGFPRWQVQLHKIRNGKPGSWPIEYRSNRFKSIADTPVIAQQEHKKAV